MTMCGPGMTEDLRHCQHGFLEAATQVSYLACDLLDGGQVIGG